MALNLGGVIRLTYAVKNDVGALANPATATLAITQPDGTLAAGIVVNVTPTITGQLVYDFAYAQFGLHSAHWATTVPTTAEDDVFTVERPASLLVSVDEAVSHLRAAGVITSDADREQLQWLCMVATDAIERDLGRTIVRRTVVETYDGGNSALILRSTPVLSITTVTDQGVSVLAADYTLDAGSGILYRGSTSYGGSFLRGRQSVTVTYVAGYNNPPPVVRKVALNAVQGMWQSSQQASHPLLDEEEAAEVSAALAAMTSYEQRGYESLRSAAIA